MGIDLSVSTIGRWKGHNPSARFWEHVEHTAQCWLWTGAVQPRGYPYGRITIRGRLVLAHRLSWTLHHGQIPDGLCVLHRCDNPRCVNPEHLFLGTQKDNTADAITKGRKAYPSPPTGERHHCAKLTAADAADIFLMARGHMPHAMIARAYGIDPSVVSTILHGKAWKGATAELRK